MSDRFEPSAGAREIASQLFLVYMGLLAVLLALIIVGAISDRYFTSRQLHSDTELDKQDAFARGMTYHQYLLMLQAEESAAAEGQTPSSDQQHAAADASPSEPPAPRADSQPEPKPQPIAAPTLPGQMTLPPPDLNISPARLADLKTRAAIIHTTLGIIPIEFNADQAPISVANFIYLAEKGFYDGMPFTRTFPGIYVAAGSPTGRRGGSAGYALPFEENNLYAAKGCLVFLPSFDDGSTGSEFGLLLDDGGSAFQGEAVVFARIAHMDRFFNLVEKLCDTRFQAEGMLDDRVYITRIEISPRGRILPSSLPQ